MLQSEFGSSSLITPTGSCASSLSDFGWPPLPVAIPVQTFDLGVQRPQVTNNQHLSSSRTSSCSQEDGRNSGEVSWMQHSHYQPPFPFCGSASSHWYSQYHHPHHQYIQLQQQQQHHQQQQQRVQHSTNADRHWLSDPINLSMTSGNHHLPTTNFSQQYSRGVGNHGPTTMLPSSSMYATTPGNDHRHLATSAIAADVMCANSSRGGMGELSATVPNNQLHLAPPSTYERTASLLNSTPNCNGRSHGTSGTSDHTAGARWYGAYCPAESVPLTTSYPSASGRRHLVHTERPNDATPSTALTPSVSAPAFYRAPGDAFGGTVETSAPSRPRQPLTLPSLGNDASSLPLSHQSRSRCTVAMTSSSGSRQTLRFKQESSDDDDENDDEEEDDEDKHRFAFGFRPTAASMSIGKTRTREKYRTVYNERQKVHLEAEYLKNPYISAERKASISQASGLSQRQVKIWFQNRRAKDRRTRYRTSAHCTSTSI